VSTTPTTEVTGSIEPGFEGVREAFEANFERGLEVGAGLCVHVDGHKVVDLHAGAFDEGGTRPYGPDTLQFVFSSTKGAAAACAHLLAQRGLLDFDEPVATYWPEFAQAGKGSMPVRFLLSHQAGLPAVDRTLTTDEFLAWDPIVAALAEQAPLWEPGTAHGYHAVSYGYLVGEVVRRISGRSLGTFFAEEIARPLGLEFYIGLPGELEPRVSPIVAGSIFSAVAGGGDNGGGGGGGGFDYSKTLLARALNLAGAIRDLDWMNLPKWHAAEMPAANGITNAVSLSRLYAGLTGTVEGGPAEPLLTKEEIEKARTVLTFGEDKVFASVGMPMSQKIGLGYWVASPYALYGGEGAFGHSGAGGSYGFADPERKLAVGYVMNKMSLELLDPRPHGIVSSIYQAIGAEPKYF
jgi:CubicO group peptidase (beta-lactamase class C family)